LAGLFYFRRLSYRPEEPLHSLRAVSPLPGPVLLPCLTGECNLRTSAGTRYVAMEQPWQAVDANKIAIL